MPQPGAKAVDGSSVSKRDWLISELKGELKLQDPDSPIERERQLADRFGVSRETVRQALATLQNEGIIYTIHGSGSYVAKRRVTNYSVKLESAEEHISPIVLDADQALLLDAKKGEPAFEITRIALDIRGREIERSISIRPGDRYDFAYHVRLEE
jgi:DNA-binding GntR family transcriptional regulator